MAASRAQAVEMVRDLMHIGVKTCPGQMGLVEAVQILLRDNLESLIVLDDNGHAAGRFGRREAVAAYGLARTLGRDYGNLTVLETMSPDIPEIPPDIPAAAAAQIMLDQNVRDLYLMHHDGGIRWPAAVLRFDDVLEYLIKKL